MVNMTAVAEAEEFLGRNLTFAESKWLHYTEGLEDYHLYWSTILLLLLFYSLVNVPYLLLDYLRLPFFEQYRIQERVYNSKESVWACFKDVIFTLVTIVGPLQVFSYPCFKMLDMPSGLPLPSLGELVLSLLVCFMVEDYGNYWLHRWMHADGWLYDHIHFKHHEYSTPMSVASTYAHWAEVLLLGIPSFVGPAILQCHVVTLWAWILLRQWEAMDTHSGYDFPWSPTHLIPFYGGAVFHDYHHLVGGQSQGNFASTFVYCDWLYGTDKGYRFKRALKAKKAKEA
eukprot:TRINITY_DN13757_c0_g1_i1.p1 TRINITY_DN13757_c0_g1~~TRINITY_DN13757_c0_g1_i1.p1  ORF type:complete len:285 (+),score=46.13 TRINITY_DN13757_c0_g1_i1:76-930(+)